MKATPLVVSSPRQPFLKWAGSKRKLLSTIREILPKGQRLVEPFVGSGAVFLGTDYAEYWLNDINADLINLYRLIQNEGKTFIDYAKGYFRPENNNAEQYFHYRQVFNSSQDLAEKAALFIYLNRHGYNGLCRYSRNGFNVPFGRYKTISFPEAALRAFGEWSKRAIFTCQSFDAVMAKTQCGDIVYCDPPYKAEKPTLMFRYYGKAFDDEAQAALAQCARENAARGIPVLMSNHDLPYIRRIYQGAELIEKSVPRFINCLANSRGKSAEILAYFVPKAVSFEKTETLCYS